MLPEQFQYIYAFDLQCGMGTLYHMMIQLNSK